MDVEVGVGVQVSGAGLGSVTHFYDSLRCAVFDLCLFFIRSFGYPTAFVYGAQFDHCDLPVTSRSIALFIQGLEA